MATERSQTGHRGNFASSTTSNWPHGDSADARATFTPNDRTIGDPDTLEPLGGGRFRLMARTGGGEIGEVVRFAEENGTVTRIYVGDGYYNRVR